MNKTIKWRLQFYPSGNNTENVEYMSLFLQLVSCDKPSIKTDFRFCLVDRNNQETNERKTSEKWQFFQGRQSGFPKFIRREFVLDPANGLLVDDRLIVRCKIKAATGHVKQASQETMEIVDSSMLLSQLSNDLDGLYQCEESSDVTLEAKDGQPFHAHKIILAARSPVFAAMFAHNMREKKESNVHINDVDSDTLSAMLRYIYTGCVVDEDNSAADGSLTKLLAVADKYALEGLKVRCEHALARNLNVRLVSDCLLVAELYNARNLKTRSINFIRAHLTEVVETSGFKSIARTNPLLLEDIIRSMTTSWRPGVVVDFFYDADESERSYTWLTTWVRWGGGGEILPDDFRGISRFWKKTGQFVYCCYVCEITDSNVECSFSQNFDYVSNVP